MANPLVGASPKFLLDPILNSRSGNPLKIFLDVEWDGPDGQFLISAAKRMEDWSPVLRTIARKVVSSSKRSSFIEQRSPEGQPWAPLKHPRGRGHNPSMKALFDSGKLFESLTYNLVGKDAVEVGFTTDAFYGVFHQLGVNVGRRSRLSDRKELGAVGIPARPFLGIGPRDLPSMSQLLSDHALGAFEEAA